MNRDPYASIDDSLRFWGRIAPQREFVLCGEDRLTFAHADEWVDRVAAYLASKGITAGDRVGILGENSIEWIIASFAVFRIGAIHCGLSDRSSAQELIHAATLANLRAVFVTEAHFGRMAEVTRLRAELQILPMAEVTDRRRSVQLDRFERPSVDTQKVAAIVLSSGSSGLPKGVAVSMNSILSVATEHILVDYEAYGKNGRNLLALPLAPMGGFLSKVTRALLAGGRCYVMQKFDEREALRLLIEEKCNTFMAPPTIYQRISALPHFQTADLSTLTHGAIGGAPVPLDEIIKWLDRGAVIRQSWGSTETGTFPPIGTVEQIRADPSICTNVSIYRRIRTERPDGTPCAPNESGEVLVSGPGLMEGYLDDQEANAAVFRNGWFRTGDLGQLDENGILKIVGRIKEIIISGGYNVSPLEVERTIEELDWVIEAAVIGVPDSKWGEGVGAIVRTAGKGTVGEITTHCRSRLAGYKMPRYVLIVDEPLPRTNSKNSLAKGPIREKYGQRLAQTRTGEERTSLASSNNP